MYEYKPYVNRTIAQFDAWFTHVIIFQWVVGDEQHQRSDTAATVPV